jgi:phosphoribosyl 1,2-cyclic phosphodiesterase
MALFVTSLNSGSNGNCYYVGTSEEAILVDAGLSCRETEKRLLRLGLSMQQVKAVFISHEHSDHIFGLEVLAKKHRLPVFITDRTRLNSSVKLHPELVNTFRAFVPVQVGSMSVYAFPKFHDAADPHSFIVSSSTTRVGIFTDIGNCCNHVEDSFSRCNAVFLESNYDEAMLMNGRYPYHLKQRIRGGKGHLSNRQALDLFLKHRNRDMSHLFLSHLSKENNRPELVEELFKPYAGSTEIVVTSRYCETPVYQVAAKQAMPLVPKQSQVQLSLF